MIVPRFSIAQTDTSVIIKINVPYIRVSESEIFAENNEFTFYCKPYFLKLAFQGQISSDESCHAKYDPNEENGTIIAELPKLIPGSFFPDLDLPSKLLLDRRRADSTKFQFPSIEIVGESDNLSNRDQIDDLPSEAVPSIDTLLTHRYGFNHKYSNVLRHQRDEILTVFTIPNPDEISPYQRRIIRLGHETASFDEDRYLGDLLEGPADPIHMEALSFTPFWEEMWSQRKKLFSESKEDVAESIEEEIFRSVGFSDEENETMRHLPQRLQFSFAEEVDEQSLYLSLIDILFAFCYDHRTTQGESTVESAYTITMLSPTLSSFEDYRKYPDEELTSYNQQHLDTLPLRDVLVQSARRTLIYPYLRTWKLVKKIYVDLTKILFLGQRCILKCLLQIHRIFEKTDTYYLLNKLYIEDYCIWLQYLGDNPEKATLTRLAKECNSLKGQISKKDMFDLNIEELEDSLGTESPLIDPSELSPIAEGDNAEEVTPQSSRPRIEVISSVQFDNKKDDENTQSG